MNKFIKAQIKTTIEHNKIVYQAGHDSDTYQIIHPNGTKLITIINGHNNGIYSVMVNGREIANAVCIEKSPKSYNHEQKDIIELVDFVQKAFTKQEKEKSQIKELEKSKATMSVEELVAMEFLQKQK